MKQFFLSVKAILILLFIILLSSCQKDDNNSGTHELYIGVILPLDTERGLSKGEVIKTAIKLINDAGGANAYTLKLDVRTDDPSGTEYDRKDQAVNVAKAILSDHSSDLIGFVTAWSSTSNGVALQVANVDSIASISGSSTSNSNSGISPYFHRLAPADKYLADILAQQAITYEITRAAIAYEVGDPYTEELAEGFADKFKANGGTITTSVGFNIGDSPSEFETNLVDLFNGDVSAIMTIMNELTPAFWSALNDNIPNLGINVSELRIIGINDNPNFLDFATPDLVVGDVGSYPKAFGVGSNPDPNSSSFQYLARLLSENYNREYEFFDGQFFDIPFIYAIAITRTIEEGITPEDIEAFRIALNANIRKISRNDSDEDIVRPEDGWANIEAKAIIGDVNYEGASGNCDIDENGDVITNYNIFKVIDDGDGTLSIVVIDNVAVD